MEKMLPSQQSWLWGCQFWTDFHKTKHATVYLLGLKSVTGQIQPATETFNTIYLIICSEMEGNKSSMLSQ